MKTKRGLAGAGVAIIMALIVAVIAGGAYFLKSKTWISNDGELFKTDSTYWQTYKNAEYGFEFEYPSEVGIKLEGFKPAGGTNWTLGGKFPVAEGYISNRKISRKSYFKIGILVYPAVPNLDSAPDLLKADSQRVSGPISGALVLSSNNGENYDAYLEDSKYALQLKYLKLEDGQATQIQNAILSTFKFTK